MKATPTTELKVLVTTLPTVTVQPTKRNDIFALKSIVPNKVDKASNKVMQAISKFSSDYKQLKAPDMKQAELKYDELINETFQVEAKTDKPKTKRTGKTKTSEAKKEEKPKVEKVKYLATFENFCETSKASCLPLTPENKKTVIASLKQFERYNKTLTSELTDAEKKELTLKDNLQAVNSLLNRNTLRLLITETSKDKKVVAQYLLKPIYFSPYSFLCVAEAHNRDTKIKSMYDDIINSTESLLTCYDSFQFNPILETLTTSETSKSTNKVEYQFVNIVIE